MSGIAQRTGRSTQCRCSPWVCRKSGLKCSRLGRWHPDLHATCLFCYQKMSCWRMLRMGWRHFWPVISILQGRGVFSVFYRPVGQPPIRPFLQKTAQWFAGRHWHCPVLVLNAPARPAVPCTRCKGVQTNRRVAHPSFGLSVHLPVCLPTCQCRNSKRSRPTDRPM